MSPGDLVKNKSHGWTALLINYDPFPDSDSGICTIQWINGPEGQIDKCHSTMLEIFQKGNNKSAKEA